MGLLVALLLPATVHAALDVQAKEVKTEANEKEEIWVIRIDPTKTHGTGKIDAKPEPLHGHPLRITSADLPGVTFGFDAAKKLTAIEITDPSRIKLPGKLVLGKSTLGDFEKSFGTSAPVEPVPTGSSSARRFKLGTATLTVRDRTESPNTAASILLD